MAPRHLAWLFLRDPERLEKQEMQILSLIRKSQQVEIAYGLVQQFVTLLKERNAQPLDAWLWDCQQSGISDLITFAASGWRKRTRLCTRHSHSRTAMGLLKGKLIS
jgi:transposase